VQGANLRTKHRKPTQQAAGGIEKIEALMHVSNVALVDPKNDVATRVGYKTLKDGKKVRFAKKSGETIE
jgi:large subunit ribosomal protein L24